MPRSGDELKAAFSKGANHDQATRILIVDDEPDACLVLDKLLTTRGYRTVTCTESNNVLGTLKVETFNCIILDILMPGGLQGTELLPIIKHNFPTLPVILLSAYCDSLDSNYYRSLGAFDLILKPYSQDVILDTISRAVGVTETIPLVLKSLSLINARDQVYRKLIVAALSKTNWNQVKAAETLGISRHCLIRWLRKLQIEY